jgi:acetyltransferase-like isoleucine patch superfamily enzyme
MSTNSHAKSGSLLSFLRSPLPEKLNRLQAAFFRLKGILYYRHVFGSFGSGSILYKPVMLSNPQFIHIGRNVVIRQGARLEAILLDPENPPELRIGDNVNIEQDVQIVLAGKIHIKDNVSITARCSLLGGNHPFFDVDSNIKIGARLTGAKTRIEIGEGSFIGVNVTIMTNVKLGRHVVVGSGSVVRSNVPDYSVVDGNPAVVRMRYDSTARAWLNVPLDGASRP